jgi:hypothetical protein
VSAATRGSGYASGVSSRENREREEPLPCYGLTGSFTGTRWSVTDTWDLCEVDHRPSGGHGIVGVVTMRRTTDGRRRGQPRVAISPELARETVTNALVLPTWRAGDEDVFSVIERVAKDEPAWKAREITFDGQPVVAVEREYQGRWVVYQLTAMLIVLAAAEASLQPEVVELRRLKPEEFDRDEAVPQ